MSSSEIPNSETPKTESPKNEILGALTERFGDAIGEMQEAIDPFLVVPAEQLQEMARFLRDDPSLQMQLLQDETATDHPDEGLIRMVYHLFSYAKGHSFKLKCELPREDPKVPTLEAVWPVANWFEREVYDLFGVQFEGHSDLRRLMLPDDWEGHPLRKDYEDPERYHGVEHERFSPIDGYTELDAVALRIAEESAAQIAAATATTATTEATEAMEDPALTPSTAAAPPAAPNEGNTP